MKCQNASSLSCGGSVSSAARTRRPAANANNNNATAAMRRCLLIRINILVTARVQSLFDPFGVALREPAFLDEAVCGFPEQVHISLPGSIQLDDTSGTRPRIYNTDVLIKENLGRIPNYITRS